MDDVIVVGIDGTAAGAAAIRWAALRADSRGLALDLVHVVDDQWGTVGERELVELNSDVSELLDSAVQLAHATAPDVASVARLRVGDPMVELAELSKTAAMIVIGTHKTGFFHGRALGSRSLQLAAMAHCPVAVIPGFAGGLRRNIVVGVDDSSAADAVIEFASRESIATGETLVMVHAVEEVQRPAVPPAVAAARSLTDRAIDQAKRSGVQTIVRAREIHRPAAEALIDAALQATLLVVGSSRRRGSELSALGPVGHDVLMNISGPTIVVHGDAYPHGVTANESKEMRDE